ncbi:MAG: ATP-binding protein [Armatimonadota bacterium]
MITAVAGKGGMGKSTISALIVRHWLKLGETPVLAVDADPNSTLEEKLGLEARCAVGDLREDVLKNKGQAPTDVPKQRAIEYEVQDAIAEGPGFDLLVMGRGEGPGCYCSVNNMLRTFVDKVSAGYKHLVIDNEAGMEHLSRRTNGKVDLLLVVCDPTPAGIKSAQRIAELARKLEVVRGRMGLVLNRSDDAECRGRKASEATGLELFGCIPDDRIIRDLEFEGEPLLNLPDDSKSVLAVQAIMQNQYLFTNSKG